MAQRRTVDIDKVRLDATASGKLIENEIAPDRHERRRALGLLADSLAYAAARTDCWGLTLRADHVRLNVGPVETVAVFPGRVRLIVDGPLGEVRRLAPKGVVCFNGYKKTEPCTRTEIPHSQLDAASRQLGAAHERLLGRAAAGRSGYSWKEAHSPGAIAYMRAVLGRPDLPDPPWSLDAAPLAAKAVRGVLWLYPISQRSGHYFTSGSWRSKDTSPESFAEMVRREEKDCDWGIKTNFKNVAEGDTIVVYASKANGRPPLVVGVGRVARPPYLRRKDDRAIDIDWDTRACMRLATRPIDATHVSENLPQQKAAVTTLPPVLQEWLREKLALPSQGGLAVIEAAAIPPSKTITVAARAYEAVVRHDNRLVGPVRERLRALGWRELSASGDGVRADYLAESPDGGFHMLVEAKTVASTDARNEIRYAIGQLLDYEHCVVRGTLGITGRLEKMIVLERKPSDGLVGLVESLKIGIAWRAGDGVFKAGPWTNRALPDLFG